MLIFRWRNDRVHEVTGEWAAIEALANIMESVKLEYKISDSSGTRRQDEFGRHGFKYWITGAFK